MMIAALAFALTVACREKPFEIKNPEILGTWKGGGQTVELLKDGTITLSTTWETEQVTGTYAFSDDDTITVTFKSSPAQDYVVSLSGDNMMVTRTDGTLIGEYKRITQLEAR